MMKETHGEVMLISLAGKLDSMTAQTFEQDLLGQIAQGRVRLVIDFSQLNYISSAGLRVILMAAKRIKVASGKLVLSGMQTHIREVFEISGFLTILNVLDGTNAAIAAAGQ
ncbi:MAG: STAS domain-containing protein [Zetaproteobacteria bacterium]|nr:STAS domain-containing protein [Zetaproteobacteria bacterium]